MKGCIEVEHLSKAYKQYDSPFGRLLEWLISHSLKKHELKWVIQDLSFHIEPGEAVGVVGINGAGKSTLLKMIAGTTKPTTGTIKMSGRVAALLELGIGFHPEFTGRQNVQMSAQLLGYSDKEINDHMQAIEDFAEIGEAINQPMRTYSSGMQMRLAFSVVTAIRPDILIVDEALSVGDAYFQHKSFARIRQFQKEGTTLLFVSHDRNAIQSICDRAILLDGGRLLKEGTPESVMDYYNAMISSRENARVQDEAIQQRQIADRQIQTISGTGEARIEKIELLNQQGELVEFVNVGELLSLKATVHIHQPIERLVMGYMIKNRLGQPIFGTNTYWKEKFLYNLKPGEKIEYIFSFPANLGMETYSISTSLSSSETHLVNNYEWRDLALLFQVININHTHFVGCNWLEPEILIQQI